MSSSVSPRRAVQVGGASIRVGSPRLGVENPLNTQFPPPVESARAELLLPRVRPSSLRKIDPDAQKFLVSALNGLLLYGLSLFVEMSSKEKLNYAYYRKHINGFFILTIGLVLTVGLVYVYCRRNNRLGQLELMSHPFYKNFLPATLRVEGLKNILIAKKLIPARDFPSKNASSLKQLVLNFSYGESLTLPQFLKDVTAVQINFFDCVGQQSIFAADAYTEDYLGFLQRLCLIDENQAEKNSAINTLIKSINDQNRDINLHTTNEKGEDGKVPPKCLVIASFMNRQTLMLSCVEERDYLSYAATPQNAGLALKQVYPPKTIITFEAFCLQSAVEPCDSQVATFFPSRLLARVLSKCKVSSSTQNALNLK